MISGISKASRGSMLTVVPLENRRMASPNQEAEIAW